MIRQQWCACGAGVVDDNPHTAQNNITEFQDFHPRICKAGLVEDQPMTVALGCPHCSWRGYGETQAQAIELRANHINANHREE